MCLCIYNSSHHFTSLHTITIYVPSYLRITLCKTDVPTKPENFTGDFEKRIPLDFFGLFHAANSYDHRAEIKFQRISAKELLKFFRFLPTSVLQRVMNEESRNEKFQHKS